MSSDIAIRVLEESCRIGVPLTPSCLPLIFFSGPPCPCVDVDVDGPETPSSPALLVTAGTMPPEAGDNRASEEDTAPDIGDSLPVSRLAGLRGRFSSWRRKRKSIPAITVADDDEDGDVENVVDSKETSAAAASAAAASKPAISRKPQAETASRSTAAQAKSRTAARQSSTEAKPLGKQVGVGVIAKAPATASVLVTDAQVVAGEVLLPVAGSVSRGGNEASSAAPVGALAVSVASEDRGAVKAAAVPAASRTLEAVGSEVERKEAKSESEQGPFAKVKAAEPSNSLGLDQSETALAVDDEPRAGQTEVAGEQRQAQTASSFAGSSPCGGASSDKGLRAQAAAKRDGGTSVGGGDDTTAPSSNLVAATAPSESFASAATPSAEVGSDDKNALLGGLDVDTPTKSTSNPGESAVAAAVKYAKDTAVVNTPTVPTSAGSTARKQAGTEAAPLKSDERSPELVMSSASSSSLVPTSTALPPRSSSRNEAPRTKKGSGNLAGQQKDLATKTEETEGPADKPVPMSVASVGKPAVLPSKAVEDDVVPAVEEVVPRVAGGKTGGVDGGSGTAEGPSSAWDAMNPAAEFLKDWVDKAVPQKKAELKRRESTVCWERQWCVPLGVVDTFIVWCFFGNLRYTVSTSDPSTISWCRYVHVFPHSSAVFAVRSNVFFPFLSL